MKSWFRFHYQNSTSFSFLSPALLLAVFLLLHQQRQELILEFCPWFPPLSPWAVTCQRCPPLGAPRCCNYLWHPGSGASTQVTWWGMGGGGAEGVERRKGRFFLSSRQGDVRSGADPPATAGVGMKLYSLPCTPIKKGHFINPKKTYCQG